MNKRYDLSKMLKSQLVEVTKMVDGEAGDYARLDKNHYVSLLTERLNNPATNGAAIAAFEKLDIKPMELTEEAPAPVSEPAMPAPNHELRAKPAEVDADAMAQMLAAMGKLIKPGLDEGAIRALVKDEVSKSELPTKRIIVNGPKTTEITEHTHPMFDDVLLYAGLRQNVMMVGPAGAGKTHLGSMVAKALDLEFASISCTAGMSEATIKGRLLPTGNGGQFEYMESDFVRLYENGGVFLLDEIDAADANVLMIINQALANGGFFIEYRPEGKTFVKRHKDFVCIAAANTFGYGADMMYAGRERLDAATLDRFEMVHVDYDAAYEKKVVDAEVYAWAIGVRQKIEGLRLRRLMSTRRMQAMSQQRGAGKSMKAIKDAYFASWSKDERQKVEA